MSKKPFKNYGYIQDEFKPSDYFYGGITGIESSLTLGNRDWSEYQSLLEPQWHGTFDDMSCVSRSALNVNEYKFNLWIARTIALGASASLKEKRALEFLKDNGYLDIDNRINFDDNFIAYVSGTTRRGNTMGNVADSIRQYGLIPEQSYVNKSSWLSYYSKPPQTAYDLGRQFLDYFNIKYEWVPTGNKDTLYYALEDSPIQIAICAYGQKKDGVYRYINRQANHCVTIFKASLGNSFTIEDHYSYEYIKTLEWNYRIDYAMKYDFIIKDNNPMLKLKNNTYTIENEKGECGLYLDGKLLVGSKFDVLTACFERNNGNVEGKFARVKKMDWDTVPKYDIKDPNKRIG